MICWGDLTGWDSTGNLIIQIVHWSLTRSRIMIYIGNKLISQVYCHEKTLDEMRDIGINKVEDILKQIHKGEK